MEAMASGRPVIASRIGGSVDLMLDGVTGFLVPPCDAGALSRAIQQLLVDPVLRKRMGQAAQQRSVLFHASVVVPRIEKVYQDLVGE
jgi:glycosyltransferase involved in cell wall biosynthesis